MHVQLTSIYGIHSQYSIPYIRVTIVFRYIFGLKHMQFASTKFCDLYAKMVQDQ